MSFGRCTAFECHRYRLAPQVIRDPAKNDFTLQLTGVLTRDAGVYECQVSTEPKMSWPVTLNVLGKTAGGLLSGLL